MPSNIMHQYWEVYINENPPIARLYSLFENDNIVNDHIAFRTFNHKKVNIDVISQIFINLGYVKKGSYKFKEKKLNAIHLEHKENINAPKIFISELIIENCPLEIQNILKQLINSIDGSIYKQKDILLKGRKIWDTPSYEIYNKIRSESEYAAWVYTNGFKVNHFTISVNHLQQFSSLEAVNKFVSEKGFLLNNIGGEIKGSKENLLQQSSILAHKIKVKFIEGTYTVPSCFCEFIQRYEDENGDIFNGFIPKNANKIFDSTNYKK